MSKLLIIGLIVIALFYFIAQKISRFKFNNSANPYSNKETIEINIPTFLLQSLLKKTLITVGIGFLLLLIILIGASKFKVILLLLPISFYLIGQFFVFNNHIKAIKRQKMTYNIYNNILTISDIEGKKSTLDLSNDTIQVKEVNAVQKNNGILLGYFELSSHKSKCYIPFLLVENARNKPFFDKLQRFNREIETKLFPII